MPEKKQRRIQNLANMEAKGCIYLFYTSRLHNNCALSQRTQLTSEGGAGVMTVINDKRRPFWTYTCSFWLLCKTKSVDECFVLVRALPNNNSFSRASAKWRVTRTFLEGAPFFENLNQVLKFSQETQKTL